MRTLSTLGGLIALLICNHCFAAPAVVPAVAYDVTDLGTLVPVDVNNRGQVLGNDRSHGARAVLWTQGRTTRLPLPPGRDGCDASALNDRGVAVGTASRKKDGGRAVLWKNGRAIVLGGPDSVALDINNAGQVVGVSAEHATLWERGRARDLGPSRVNAEMVLINDSGEIIIADWETDDREGQTYRAVRRGERYVLVPMIGVVRTPVLDAGVTASGPPLSPFAIFPRALNDAGEMAGVNMGQGDYDHRVFLWRPRSASPDTIRELAAPGDVDASADGINGHGDVVGGHADNGTFPGLACLWRGGRVYDLNTLIPPASGWTLTAAVAINDRGQIVGTGKHNGVEHGFLLTPRAP